MTEEDLALTCRSVRVRGGIWLPQFVAGFNVDLRALLEGTQVVVGPLVE